MREGMLVEIIMEGPMQGHGCDGIGRPDAAA